MSGLESFLIGNAFGILLIFSRVGSAVMAMPGIGEAYVSARVRLLFALLVSLVLLPPMQASLPPAPDSPWVLLKLLTGEVIIGVFLGGLARLLLMALHTAGMMISAQSSLSGAMLFDPSQSSQGSMFGLFMSTLAIVMIFITDLHHVMLRAFADSYTLFSPGEYAPPGDVARYYAQLLGKSFALAFKLSAPVLVVTLMLQLGSGILARLMPAMQVFFVILPAQVMLAIVLFTLTLSSVMLAWMQETENALGGFLGF